MEDIKHKKMIEAKELKESFKIIRENIGVLKEKVILENKQQKNVIKAKEKIFYDSILEYKMLKKIQVKINENEEYNRLMIGIKEKENQLGRLKLIGEKQ